MDRKIDSFVKDGTHYLELFCKCPNCIEVGRDVPPSFWYCEDCGGEIYVGDNAHLYCKECGRERHIMHSAFKSPFCCKVSEEMVNLNLVYREGQIDQNIHIAGQMVRVACILWLQSFKKNE